MTESLAVLGFPNESPLVEAVAAAISAPFEFASEERFSAGEWHIRGPRTVPATVLIATNIGEDPQTLFRACLLAESIRRHGATKIVLIAPWIAYGRQDRVCHPGDAPAGLLVGTWLQQSFDKIYTFDAHSESFMKSFGGKIQNVYTNPGAFSAFKAATLVVAPDNGAEERARIAADSLHLPVFILNKTRQDGTVEMELPQGMVSLVGQVPLLVDDMSDTGGTLIAAAKELRLAGASQVYAFIPHALRRQILETKMAGMIDRLECAFDHEAGIYAENQLSLLAQAFLQTSS